MLGTSNWRAITTSWIQPLLGPQIEEQEYFLSTELQQYLDNFETAQTDNVLRDAANLLSESMLQTSGKIFDSKSIGRWPAMVSEEFYERLKAHQPEALVILAHYSLIVRANKARWWIGGWDDMLLSAVDEAMTVEDKIRLDWSVEKMRRLLDLNVRI